jgi:hypothetical protein
MARIPGNKNYGKQEITLLLTILEEQMPTSPAEWSNVADEYAARKELSWGNRTAVSLRRKFSALVVPSGSESCSPLQVLALRIKARIDRQYGVQVEGVRVPRPQLQPTSALESDRLKNVAQLDLHSTSPQQQGLPAESAAIDAASPGEQAQGSTYGPDALAIACVPGQVRNELTQDKEADASCAEPLLRELHGRTTETNDAARPTLMQLYHEIIQLAVKAQLDSDSREMQRELRER